MSSALKSQPGSLCAMNRVTTLITSLVMFGMTVGGTCFAEDRISFVEQVRPILSENCFHCHGPDAAKREADLRLDERDGAIDYGAIVPGKEGHIVVKLPYKDNGSRVGRAWIGTADRTLSFVGKGEYAPAHQDYDIHAIAPDPLPGNAMWWSEIEKLDGTKVVGSAKPNMP